MSNHRTVRIFKSIAGQCRWCGLPLTQGRSDRRWHDGRAGEMNCLDAYFMATSADHVRRKTKAEGWYFCTACGRTGPGRRAQTPRELLTALSWDDYEAFRRIDEAARGMSRWRHEAALEVDHVVPLIDGGSHGPENLQLLCPVHHRAKTAREARARAGRRRRAAAPPALW